MKKIVFILLFLLAALLLVWFGARRYLNSRQVVDKVTAHLQQAYGGNVKLDEVDIGLASSALNRIDFFEVDCDGGPSEKTPWVSIDSFSTDISIFDLLKQQAIPTQVKVIGVKLFLRFGKDGKLLTCLPPQLSLSGLENPGRTPKIGAFPLIEVDDSQVTLHTKGSPDLVFKKLSTRLEKKKDQVLLTGSMENPEWGKWTISGLFVQDSQELAVHFTSTAPVHFTQAMKDQLPFVPASTWEGRNQPEAGPTQLRVIYDMNQGKLLFKYLASGGR